MTRAARISMYPPDLNPVTMVLLEGELAVPWEEAIETQRVLAGGYVVIDEFDTDDEIIGATFEAMQRGQAALEREGMAAMLYHYDGEALSRVTESGTLTATLPAPLTADEIIGVFEQLAHHPAYRHQLVVAISEDEKIVTMRDGDAHVIRDGGSNGDVA